MYQSVNRTSNGSAQTGSGVLRAALLAAGSASATLTIYDNTAGSGTILAKLQAVQNTTAAVQLNVVFTHGCYMALQGTGANGTVILG